MSSITIQLNTIFSFHKIFVKTNTLFTHKITLFQLFLFKRKNFVLKHGFNWPEIAKFLTKLILNNDTYQFDWLILFIQYIICMLDNAMSYAKEKRLVGHSSTLRIHYPYTL